MAEAQGDVTVVDWACEQKRGQQENETSNGCSEEQEEKAKQEAGRQLMTIQVINKSIMMTLKKRP